MKDKLVNSHMIDLFANSGWKDGLVTGNSFYLKKINELHNRLSQLQIVEQFHYISNPNSLIHWALTYVFILPSSFLRLSSSTFLGVFLVFLFKGLYRLFIFCRFGELLLLRCFGCFGKFPCRYVIVEFLDFMPFLVQFLECRVVSTSVIGSGNHPLRVGFQ